MAFKFGTFNNVTIANIGVWPGKTVAVAPMTRVSRHTMRLKEQPSSYQITWEFMSYFWSFKPLF